MADAQAPASPLPWLLLLLSFVTGLVDAASVLGLGKVFTANMTGNIVFLGFGVVGTPGFAIWPFLVAIAAFLIGALPAGYTGRRLSARPLRRWLTIAALVEAALLWAAAGVAAWTGSVAPQGSALYAIIALTAVAMGFRNATIRQLKVPDLTTTVLTLTITGIAADSRLAGGTGANLARRIGSVLTIFLGAAAGATMLMRYGLAAPLALAGALVLLGTLACMAHPAARDMRAG
ncbi:MAG: YoaK family protein [Pseudomonadota bacterium]|uniref:YoaK family protein n=1 Tax=Sphingobium sp. TaxID=1912891 RepID=UPI002E1F9C01